MSGSLALVFILKKELVALSQCPLSVILSFVMGADPSGSGTSSGGEFTGHSLVAASQPAGVCAHLAERCQLGRGPVTVLAQDGEAETQRGNSAAQGYTATVAEPGVMSMGLWWREKNKGLAHYFLLRQDFSIPT